MKMCGDGRASRFGYAVAVLTLLQGAPLCEVAHAVARCEPAEVQNAGAGGQPAASHNGGSVTGTVLDINQGAVPGARVTLLAPGRPERVTTADATGGFLFADVAPGKYRLTITSEGLATFVSSEFSLREGQQHQVAKMALPIATTNTQVEVRVTETQLASEQVDAEVKQRMLGGVLPNFYSSYIWNAAPLPAKQKFRLAFRSRTDPTAFLTAGVVAEIEQHQNRFPGYGDGAQGYAKRYGATYATGAISRFMGSAVFPTIFHQDPRYFYKGSGSVPSRAWYAMTRSVVSRGDNGKWQPNYSHVLGSLSAGAISNLYHPGTDRGAALTFENTGIGIGSSAVSNLIREFVFRAITRNVPDYEQGQPEAKK